ncbi:hypothetical protein DFH09DRAFT_1470520 [Mycena vulgaris]|nr:hypothetical protein DFH09DRAFT_1470520 [Mycena vulgaris]
MSGSTNSGNAADIRAIFDVPPELWALVAKVSRRQAIAHLCLVSREFYAVFAPLLYRTTRDPPLRDTKALRLMETLGAACTPHPALLVRELVFPAYAGYRPIDTKVGLTALRRLFDAPGGGRPIRSSVLRAFEWDLGWTRTLSVTNSLGPLLLTPGCFPDLKEITIAAPVFCKRFDFLRIPNLEKIDVSVTLCDCKKWRASCDALAAELKSLPVSSPLLHTLKLRLWMAVGRKDDTSPPWDVYISRMSPPSPPGPDADFSPLISAHPHLTHLALDAVGTQIPAVPALRAFTGSLAHCATVAGRAPELAELCVLFPYDFDPDALPALFPPGASQTLTLLNVSFVDEDGHFASFPRALFPRSLGCLASAFPHLADLHVTLARKIKDYTANLVALPHLESLCLRAHMYLPERSWYDPVAKIFPVAEYAAYIGAELLPSLGRLKDVRIILRGDRIPQRGCSTCDEDRADPGPLQVEYRFRVRHTPGQRKGKVVIVDEA